MNHESVARLLISGFFCVSLVSSQAKDVLFSFDSFLSPQAQQECKDVMTGALVENPIAQALDITAQKLPFVKRISLSASCPSVYAISVLSKEPSTCIDSHKFLLLEDNSLIHESHYNTKLVKSLPKCRLMAESPDSSLHHAFTTFVRNLDMHVLRMFDMTWHNENYIEFVQQAEPVVIIACNMTHVTMKLLRRCMEIAHQIIAQDAGKKGIKGYAVDIRFKDQIVVYRV